MKIKRAQVFQLITYITPLSPQDEPVLLQKISGYTEEELNTVYMGCYQKLQERQRLEQEQAQQVQQAQQQNPPQQDRLKVEKVVEDEFSSSNFQGEEGGKG